MGRDVRSFDVVHRAFPLLIIIVKAYSNCQGFMVTNPRLYSDGSKVVNVATCLPFTVAIPKFYSSNREVLPTGSRDILLITAPDS